jgi:hypothetical protein
MKIKKTLGALAMGITMVGMTQAASVSYFLDQVNDPALADGVNYLMVTVDDEGAAGAINFTVEALGVLGEDSNFGIQTFGFNGDALGSSNLTLPGGWTFSNDQNISVFGNFTNYLQGTGDSRQDPLAFSIVGVDGDVISDYLSEGAGGMLFATHLAGFTEVNGITSAHFAGNTDGLVPPSAVPLPAAVWLLGSGLVGLGVTGRRKAEKLASV